MILARSSSLIPPPFHHCMPVVAQTQRIVFLAVRARHSYFHTANFPFRQIRQCGWTETDVVVVVQPFGPTPPALFGGSRVVAYSLQVFAGLPLLGEKLGVGIGVDVWRSDGAGRD